MPDPHPSAPTREQIRRTSGILAGLSAHLREEPPPPGMMPLLAPLRDEDDGMPRALARTVQNRPGNPRIMEAGFLRDDLRDGSGKALSTPTGGGWCR